jgi:macrolide transport system ATP-binding/permease protein
VSIWTRLAYLLPSRRRTEERDMREELESLREIAGARELGNLTIAAENAREVSSIRWLEHLWQDLRYAVRSMHHNKAFTALAVLSLALGIGANTAIYSFTESILLRSLPVPDPDSLVVMKWRAGNDSSGASRGISFSTDGSHTDAAGARIYTQFDYPALELFQRNTDVLSSVFCYFVADRLSVTVNGETETLKGEYVSGEYFRGMGVSPAAGRAISASDEPPGAELVAMLSHRYSQGRFGDVARSIGQTIRINNKPVVVAGVAPAGFFGAEPGYVPDVYVPISVRALLESPAAQATPSQRYVEPGYYWIEIMGRLAPGVDPTRAQAVLAPQFQQYVEASLPAGRPRIDLPELRIVEGATGLDSLRRRYEKPVYLLMAIVGLILVIACANVANLLLARATARQREIAVRLSIGASRARVVRQLLTESLVLSLLGGALGMLVASWGIQAITVMLANGRENFTLHAGLNGQVLGVTLVLSVLTGVVFGLAPALQATRADVMPALKAVRAGTHTEASRRSGRAGLSQGLVVAQIGLSLVLLVAAGLFGSTLSNLHAIELGFNRDNVLLFTIKPDAAGYERAALNRLYLDLRERLRGLPGVQAVSLSDRPLPAGGGTVSIVTAVGVPPPPPRPPGTRAPNAAGLFDVGPDFFTTMEIPLRAGREFTDRDVRGTFPVAVINQKLANVLQLQDLIGSRIQVGPRDTFEIIGVVGDALFLGLKDDARPMVYLPTLQGRESGRMTYEVRATGNPARLGHSVREIVRQMDPRVAVFDLKTQAVHIDQAISQEIALARLCTGFAVLALIIACVGLYGTVAFNVTRRTSEIGIRMALGAQRTGILWLFLASVFRLELIGLAVGIPIALAGSRYVESLLFGIRPTDPASIAAAVVILLAAGLTACLVPARRATLVDPVVALRSE